MNIKYNMFSLKHLKFKCFSAVLIINIKVYSWKLMLMFEKQIWHWKTFILNTDRGLQSNFLYKEQIETHQSGIKSENNINFMDYCSMLYPCSYFSTVTIFIILWSSNIKSIHNLIGKFFRHWVQLVCVCCDKRYK